MNSEWLIVRPIQRDKTLYCCSTEELNRGSWTLQEDQLLSNYIQAHGHGNWRTLPPRAGLNRSGKSCRLRWLNYLSPDIVRGNISKDEEDLIIRLHSLLGNRWSLIAKRLPGRTDNEIKNHWNTYMAKRLCSGKKPSTIRKKRTESVEKKRNPRLFHTKAIRCKALRFPIVNPNQGSYGCQMIGKNASSSTSHESTNHDDLNVASMHLGDPKAVHGELECVVAHCHGNKQCCNNNIVSTNTTTWTMGQEKDHDPLQTMLLDIDVGNVIDNANVDDQELGRVMVYDHGYGQGEDLNPHCSLTDIDVLNEDPYYVQNPVADDLFPWAEDYQAFTVNDANCHPYEYELNPFHGRRWY